MFLPISWILLSSFAEQFSSGFTTLSLPLPSILHIMKWPASFWPPQAAPLLVVADYSLRAAQSWCSELHDPSSHLRLLLHLVVIIIFKSSWSFLTILLATYSFKFCLSAWNIVFTEDANKERALWYKSIGLSHKDAHWKKNNEVTEKNYQKAWNQLRDKDSSKI